MSVVRLVVSLWQRVCDLAMSLNPLRVWIDYRRQRDLAEDRRREADRLDRAEERELLRQTISSLHSTMEHAFEVSKVQADAMSKWVTSFDSGGAPEVREWDEDADTQKYLERHGGQAPRPEVKSTLPAELVGLSKIEQFELLLNKMGS